MLFRKPAAEITLSIDQLAGYLQERFDAKMAGFAGECSELLERASRCKADFASACESFGSLTAEPDLEYTPNASASFVKESKSAYIKSMRALLAKHEKRADDANVYSRYKVEQEELEAFIGEVLHANGQFGLVLTAYSNDIERLRRAFTTIERANVSLKRVIAAHEPDYEDYASLSDEIEKLKILTLELAALNAASAAPVANLAMQKPENSDLAAKLAAERAALKDVVDHASNLEKEIAAILLPLERSARKYAHSQVKKSRLLEYITKPTSTLVDKESRSDLLEAVKKMGAEVDAGKMQVKSMERVLGSVDAIKDGSLFRLLDEHRLAREAAARISAGITELERAESSAKSSEAQAKAVERSREEAQQRADAVRHEMQRLRQLMQQQFLDCYGTRVRIV